MSSDDRALSDETVTDLSRRGSGETEELRVELSFGPDLDPKSARFEAEVFERRYGNTAEEFEREYAPFLEGTTMISVYDQHDEVRAVARMAIDTGTGLKTLLDASAEPWNIDIEAYQDKRGRENLIDLLTLSSKGMQRTSTGHPLASSAIFAAIQRFCVEQGRPVSVGMVDVPVLKYIRRFLGIPYHELEGAKPAPYMGSVASVPTEVVLADLPGVVPGLVGQLLVDPVVDLRDEVVIDLTNTKIPRR